MPLLVYSRWRHWHFDPQQQLCFSGEYKVSGRDSLVFLVDASKEMLIKGENGEPSNFDITMQVTCKVM